RCARFTSVTVGAPSPMPVAPSSSRLSDVTCEPNDVVDWIDSDGFQSRSPLYVMVMSRAVGVRRRFAPIAASGSCAAEISFGRNRTCACEVVLSTPMVARFLHHENGL